MKIPNIYIFRVIPSPFFFCLITNMCSSDIGCCITFINDVLPQRLLLQQLTFLFYDWRECVVCC